MELILREVYKAALLAWSKRHYGMVVALLVFAAFVGLAHFGKNSYRASARVYVQSNSVIRPMLNGLAVHYDDIGQVDVLENTLLSETNISRILKKVRFPGDETKEGHFINIEKLRKNAKITEISKNFFEISYTDNSPSRAKGVVEAMIGTLSDDIMGRDNAEMEAAATFIDQQIAAYEEKLRVAERRRADFRTLFMDVLPDEFNGGLSHLDILRGQIAELKTEIADEQEKLDVLKKSQDSTPEYVPPDTVPQFAADALVPQLAAHDPNPALTEARLRLQQLETRFTSDYPEVITQKNLIAILSTSPVTNPAEPEAPPRQVSTGKSAAAGDKKMVKNPEYTALGNRIIDVETAIATEKRHLSDEQKQEEDLYARLLKEPMVQAEYQNLNRDYGIIKDNYEKLLDRREQLHISMAIGSGNEKDKLEVVQKPYLPKEPTYPLKKISLILALPLAILAGIGSAFIAGQLSPGILHSAELREFDVYILGDLSSPPAQRAAVVRAAAFPIAFVLALAFLETSMLVFFRSHFT
jgi:polysaccharide chain length determinant protein (PEP-CTERM system associated)